MSEELDRILKPKSKDYKLEDITNVNHKPHPYCITPKHLSVDSMYLDDRTIKEAEKEYGARCGMYVKGDKYTNQFSHGYKRCEIPYEEHTSDKVLFIKALVDKPIKELSGLQSYLKSIMPIMEKLHIDGVVIIEPDK